MTRPRCNYRIAFCPKVRSFQPEGEHCAGNDCISISEAETEALRLKNIQELDQTQAAEAMGISQSSFQRLLSSAYKKVSQALVEGKSIVITDDKENL